MYRQLDEEVLLGSSCAEVLARGSHERLGSASPVALLGGTMLQDLCKATSETLVVLDAWAAPYAWSPCPSLREAPAHNSPQLPVYARPSGLAADRWRWRTGAACPAECGESDRDAGVQNSAAAKLGPGLVLATGGSLVHDGLPFWSCPFGPSRIFDVARGAWIPCDVPELRAIGHAAVNHEGDYYVVGGSLMMDTTLSVRVLAQDGAQWSCCSRESGRRGDPFIDVSAACSLAGSLWALYRVNSAARLVRFDPREGTWSQVQASWLEEHASDASMAASGSSLCAVGGTVPPRLGHVGHTTRQCQRLDVRMAKSWQAMASLWGRRRQCGLVRLENECLVAAGGWREGGSEARRSVEIYVPSEDMWYVAPHMPVPCGAIGMTTVALPTFA
eukprot:m51a1_g14128 hypothetical protein (388) ;mRNA; f:210079-211242